MALDGLAAELARHFGAKRSKVYRRYKVGLVRYADDFVITGKSASLLEDQVKPVVVDFLAKRGLTLSNEKTVVTSVDKGFDFLGWNVRRYGDKLLIKPAAKNAKAFLAKVRHLIRSHPTAEQVNLIKILNPVIRGWVNYHKHQVASDAFSRVDAQVFKALWRWAKRRHSAKGRRWIAKRYWQPHGTRQWTFATEGIARNGNLALKTLVYASDTAIKRHHKVQADFNPFDPAWEAYGEDLMQERMGETLAYRKNILSLYRSQQGKCALCSTAITKETGWNDHHIVYRIHGGDNSLANRVLLHPVCHQQLHRESLSVTKPAPRGA
jgi:RNA-directed DNA polymerase